jgi:co-chaperonin GroES (HSP10)
MIIPLGQSVLIERDKIKTETILRKSGVLKQANDQLQASGLCYGTVLYAPEDQNMLLDRSRPINPVSIQAGDRVWYSEFSVGYIEDDRDDHQGELLDMVPLEDIRALIQ